MNAQLIARRIITRYSAVTGSKPRGPSATPLETDWRKWLVTLFPDHFPKEFAPHHEEFWEWVWAIRIGVPVAEPYIAIWPRGGAKSTNAEAAVAALGARGARKYIWYVSETQDQADEHVANIAAMLEAPSVEKWYPELAKRMLGKFGNVKGWRRNRLHTSTGFTVDALGLDTARRGFKHEEQRPDLVVIDDIDGEIDTRAATEKKIKILTRKILPAGSTDLGVLAVQNLVHRDSVFAQLADGRADFLADRHVSGPYPALRNFEYERRSGKAYITAGDPVWVGQGLEECQRYINIFGLEAFLAECQHDVTQTLRGSVFPAYDELYHVITWSEFARLYGDIARDVYGAPRIPQHWLKGRAMDWGTTLEHPTGVVWMARPGEADPLNDSVFWYRELLMPEYPLPITLNISPQGVARAIVDAERPWGEALQMTRSLMSHEQTAVQNAFLFDMPPELKLNFGKWRPDRRAGIGVLQNYKALIDLDRPHPFRPRLPDGAELKGRPRLYLVVDDSQGEIYQGSTGDWEVRQATDAGGLARSRAEIVAYRYPPDSTGQERELPTKIFDDIIDPAKALADVFFPNVAKQTDEERVENLLPAKLRMENIAAISGPDRAISDFCRYTAVAAAKQQIKQSIPVDYRRSVRDKYRQRRY